MLYLLILILAYGLAFVLALLAGLNRAKPVGVYLATIAGLLFLPLVINIGFTAAAAPFHYDGTCYGFTDGKWECGLWEYAVLQMDYAFLFTIFFNMLWFGLLLLMCGTNLVLCYLRTRQA